MPHLTLEYSANLREQADLRTLCRGLAKVLQDQRDAEGRPVYPLGGIRVRMLCCDDYWIGDGSVEAGFVHANLKIGAGRSEAVRKATGEALFEVIKAAFAPVFERQGLALSLELNEFNEAGTWKHNNLHQRLRDAASKSDRPA